MLPEKNKLMAAINAWLNIIVKKNSSIFVAIIKNKN